MSADPRQTFDPASDPSTPDPEEIRRTVEMFLPDGHVVELRALGVSTPSYRAPHVESGYFDNIDAMADAALQLAGSANGVYATLNPVSPELLARSQNRIQPVRQIPLTKDSEVIERSWLLVDIDPVRPAGISSTAEELQAAMDRARELLQQLRVKGWPEPLVANSGNGAHLLYRVQLPTNDGGVVKSILDRLDREYSDNSVRIDKAVHNPARISKLYGTVARKGDSIPKRPHRVARILDLPERMVPVPQEALELVAQTGANSVAIGKPILVNRSLEALDLARWIEEHGLQVKGPTPWNGGQKWIVSTCPWDPAHDRGEAFVAQHPNGAISAGCLHARCPGSTSSGNHWQELRDRLDLSWRQSKARQTSEIPPIGRVNETSPDGPSNRSDRADLAVMRPSWPSPLAGEALYGLAGDFVRMIEPHTEADPAALLVQFEVAFGNLIGPKPNFVVEADRHQCNEFCVVVGDTSKGRKGTALGHVRNILRLIEKDWEANNIKSGLASGEGLLWHVRDAGTVKPAGARKKPEVDNGVSDKRLLAIESEFAAVLKIAARQGNTLSPVVRQFWDCPPVIQTLTKNSPVKATGAHVSIVGHVTLEEIRRHLTSTEAANGFANRFLWVCSRRSKCLPEGGKIHQVDLAPFARQLAESAKFAATIDVITRDDAARAVWREVYPQLSEGATGMFGAVTSRAEAHVSRLAAIYALLDLSAVIRQEHLLAALAVWTYCEDSARFIFGDALGDETADEILRLLRQFPAGRTRNEIRDHFQRNRSSAEIARALAYLAQQGLVRFDIETDTGGRNAERWFAV